MFYWDCWKYESIFKKFRNSKKFNCCYAKYSRQFRKQLFDENKLKENKGGESKLCGNDLLNEIRISFLQKTIITQINKIIDDGYEFIDTQNCLI